MVKRFQQIPSERELCRRLWKDDNLRELCDMETEENPCHPSRLSRFRNRVGTKRPRRIMNKLLNELLRSGLISGETVVLDATFVKAYSRRDSHDNTCGEPNPEAGLEGTEKPTSSATNCTLRLTRSPSCPWQLLLRRPTRTKRNMLQHSFRRR
jgi:hypothetical protein